MIKGKGMMEEGERPSPPPPPSSPFPLHHPHLLPPLSSPSITPFSSLSLSPPSPLSPSSSLFITPSSSLSPLPLFFLPLHHLFFILSLLHHPLLLLLTPSSPLPPLPSPSITLFSSFSSFSSPHITSSCTSSPHYPSLYYITFSFSSTVEELVNLRCNQPIMGHIHPMVGSNKYG